LTPEWRIEAGGVYFSGGLFSKYFDQEKGTSVIANCIASLDMVRHHDGRRLLFELGPSGCTINGVWTHDATLFLAVIDHVTDWKDVVRWYRMYAPAANTTNGQDSARGREPVPDVLPVRPRGSRASQGATGDSSTNAAGTEAEAKALIH
jgi:hypothetical protein